VSSPQQRGERVQGDSAATSPISSVSSMSGQRIVIVGGRRLEGVIPISGSKNAAVALMAGAILAAEGKTTLRNVPRISDIQTLADVLRHLGVTVSFSDDHRTATIDATRLVTHEAPAELVARMRASFWVLGPVLARLKRARIPQPGGCNIGARAIDLHIKGVEALGAKVEVGYGAVTAEAPGGLKGTSIYLDLPSVGATMNIMMAAALAEGTTIIENAAQEPDVEDLGNLLLAMGANISGHGTGMITIEGVSSLHGADYSVMPDRIEAGTYACMAAITGGDVLLQGANAAHLRPVLMKMAEAGIRTEEPEGGVRILGAQTRLRATRVIASPHPGFPTDVQQPFTAVLSLAEGTSVITDTVYESRFRYLTEMAKMGAKVDVEGRTAVITGVDRLTGSDVEATDLRAGAALIVAALAAEGRSRVFHTEHVERGYEGIVEKLSALGATIWREDENGRRVGGEALSLCA